MPLKTFLQKQLRNPDSVILLLAAGFLIRLLFMCFLAEPYFGRKDIHVDGDTFAFAWSFQNLIETGEYTVNPSKEYGYFGRMPGYPFFIGLFYLLSGQDWNSAFRIIAWVQLFLDLCTGWLLYLTAMKLWKHKPAALIVLLLYMCYPFAIVWTPVVYAESLGIFLTVLAFYFYVRLERPYHPVWCGLTLGLGILVRPQAFLLLAAFILMLPFAKSLHPWHWLKKALLILLPALLLYAAWPLRNWINHGKPVLTQDLRAFYNWDIDVLAFMQYMFSVKSGWEPQYSALIRNEKVTFPPESYRNREDSLMLEKAVSLARECGSGFSHKKGYWKAPFDEPNCNREVKALFDTLRQNQIRYNPWNFYVKVPLKNLQKALFKTSLTDNAGFIRKLASLLFIYRTVLILAGLMALFIIWFRKKLRQGPALAILVYAVLLYLLLCAGTAEQMRNIEMRYFVPADVLLLLPAAFLLGFPKDRQYARKEGNAGDTVADQGSEIGG
ncbi:MAG TPA: glycosyltransferase family 39 protein [Bacteroidales bacterium]|nr:glycosyltransferase family 39 protein [Bacteroidales bacterium]HSA43496.1 glycosyltransferase family 39 protein [Bacteroidales bacterium]